MDIKNIYLNYNHRFVIFKLFNFDQNLHLKMHRKEKLKLKIRTRDMQINSRRLTLLRWKTTCINMHEIMLIEFHCSFRKKVRQIGGIPYVL